MGIGWFCIDFLFQREPYGALLDAWIIGSCCVCAVIALFACVRIAVVDCKTRLIPKDCLVALILVRVQLLVLSSYDPSLALWFGLSSLIMSSIAACIISALFALLGVVVSALSHEEAVGFGDVKLLFVLLLLLPYDMAFAFLSILAVVGAVGALLIRIIRHRASFAYGPLLVGSFVGTTVLMVI